MIDFFYKLCTCFLISLFLMNCQSNEWLEKHKPINYLNQTQQPLIQTEKATASFEKIIIQDHPYHLYELIDLALSHHADLKIAWQQAKQTTIATDLVKASYLPIINAGVVAGYQKNNFEFPYDIYVDEHTKEIIPNLALQWLLFDFGERGDLLDATKHLTEVAQYNFDLINQKIVHQITLTYYNYIDAVKQRLLNEEIKQSNEVIQKSVHEKRKAGFATVVEVAQVDQLVSESNLNLVIAQNQERNTYQLLVQALDLPPLTKLDIAIEAQRPLPKEITPNIKYWIQLALSNRPDVLASYEVIKAKEANVNAAEKSYLPKVYAGAGWAHAKGYLGVQPLPDLNQNINGTNLLLGVAIPIYDGGARGSRLDEARSQVITSQEEHQNIKNAVAHEIMLATNALNSALQSHKSAVELVKTAQITYRAALASYQNGMATVSLVNEAIKNLSYAKTIENQSYTASLVAASTLAFTLGYSQNSHSILY